ncbi:DUF2235 domain-containing protein [Halomonas sp. DP8Y7-3]|uniref:DUF2235 domain-containing protein n=1 Tax=Halomonas sp. DP8Y7-3 TaxID=2859079 RepID=UPI001C968DA3|nr:DUF2235 domain-containing protein [Halomonas sp. DP8Y7-3]MBY5930749.1 DUF2235 domain-containing protein [Halomonas sp. DP8Y7-3]
MAKNVALFFDGTWQVPDTDLQDGDTNTNVSRLYQAVLENPMAEGGTITRYYRGVGSGRRWYERLVSGATGLGLSDILLDAYVELIDLLRPGDRLFLFGFSRGAYTARSLSGLLHTTGLLRPAHRQLACRAYRLYRDRRRGPHSAEAKRFASRYTWMPDIHMIGVWDTVGSLGIPLRSFANFNRRLFEFHDTRLSPLVRHAYQALAIDEHREAFAPTLWSPQTTTATLEQAWFPGAHSNVGGGVEQRALSDISLDWMMTRAALHGLTLAPHSRPLLGAPPRDDDIVDSYALFLSHLYQLVSPLRYLRPVGFARFGNECLHASVAERQTVLPHYRPRNAFHPSLSHRSRSP